MSEPGGGYSAHLASGGASRLASPSPLSGADVGEVEALYGYHRDTLAHGVSDQLADRLS